MPEIVDYTQMTGPRIRTCPHCSRLGDFAWYPNDGTGRVFHKGSRGATGLVITDFCMLSVIDVDQARREGRADN